MRTSLFLRSIVPIRAMGEAWEARGDKVFSVFHPGFSISSRKGTYDTLSVTKHNLTEITAFPERRAPLPLPVCPVLPLSALAKAFSWLGECWGNNA